MKSPKVFTSSLLPIVSWGGEETVKCRYIKEAE
jgi:hypothetical protein